MFMSASQNQNQVSRTLLRMHSALDEKNSVSLFVQMLLSSYSALWDREQSFMPRFWLKIICNLSPPVCNHMLLSYKILRFCKIIPSCSYVAQPLGDVRDRKIKDTVQ